MTNINPDAAINFDWNRPDSVMDTDFVNNDESLLVIRDEKSAYIISKSKLKETDIVLTPCPKDSHFWSKKSKLQGKSINISKSLNNIQFRYGTSVFPAASIIVAYAREKQIPKYFRHILAQTVQFSVKDQKVIKTQTFKVPASKIDQVALSYTSKESALVTFTSKGDSTVYCTDVSACAWLIRLKPEAVQARIEAQKAAHIANEDMDMENKIDAVLMKSTAMQPLSVEPNSITVLPLNNTRPSHNTSHPQNSSQEHKEYQASTTQQNNIGSQSEPIEVDNDDDLIHLNYIKLEPKNELKDTRHNIQQQQQQQQHQQQQTQYISSLNTVQTQLNHDSPARPQYTLPQPNHTHPPPQHTQTSQSHQSQASNNLASLFQPLQPQPATSTNTNQQQNRTCTLGQRNFNIEDLLSYMVKNDNHSGDFGRALHAVRQDQSVKSYNTSNLIRSSLNNINRIPGIKYTLTLTLFHHLAVYTSCDLNSFATKLLTVQPKLNMHSALTIVNAAKMTLIQVNALSEPLSWNGAVNMWSQNVNESAQTAVLRNRAVYKPRTLYNNSNNQYNSSHDSQARNNNNYYSNNMSRQYDYGRQNNTTKYSQNQRRRNNNGYNNNGYNNNSKYINKKQKYYRNRPRSRSR